MIKETWTESVRNRIVMYLINYRDHREQLEQRPYFLFEDLAVVFRVADLDDPLREQPVENADLERWHIQKEELYQYAVKNTPELFPAQVKTAEKAEEGNDREPVFIVSSRQGIYGASVLLYPGFLEDFSGRYPWNFFFMPLTLHEVFILLDRGQYMPDQLHEIAQTYTSEIISKKDRLSDNIYYYDSEEYQILTLY